MTKWGDDKPPNRALPPSVCFPNTTSPIKQTCGKAHDCRPVLFPNISESSGSTQNLTALVMVIFKIHWRSCFAEPKIKTVPDYSCLNHWLGRSGRSRPLIHFDCMYTTPVVKCDPLQSESKFLCQVLKMGPVIWSQRPRPSWVIGGGWANLGNQNVVKVSLQSLPVYNCGSVIYRPQRKNK